MAAAGDIAGKIQNQPLRAGDDGRRHILQP